MTEYHKIQTIFQRDPENLKHLVIGAWTFPEFEYLANNPWEFTEKVDGTNIRVTIHPKGDILFGGKTDAASIPAPLVKRLVDRFHTQEQLLWEKFPQGATLYGEGYGARIQKGGGNYRQDQDFVLFDALVTSEDGRQWWLQRPNVEEVGAALSLDVVPLIGRGTLHDMIEIVKNGFNSQWGDFMAEGIVARPAVELRTRSGARIITKLKHKDFPK